MDRFECIDQGGHFPDNQGRCHECGAHLSERIHAEIRAEGYAVTVKLSGQTGILKSAGFPYLSVPKPHETAMEAAKAFAKRHADSWEVKV